MLSELQQRVARIVAGLADADDFVLAGGAALILHGMVERSTRDLDEFATASDADFPDPQNAGAVRGRVARWRRELTLSLQDRERRRGR